MIDSSRCSANPGSMRPSASISATAVVALPSRIDRRQRHLLQRRTLVRAAAIPEMVRRNAHPQYGEYSGAALQSGLGPVLTQLGFRMQDRPPSLVIAILLAYFGGIVGLHHFYLGRRRQGVLCCVFFWTAVPLILGIVEAFRLALGRNPVLTSTAADAAWQS